MAELDKDSQEKIQKIQQIEQTSQNLLAQRQQLSQQLSEIDTALAESKDSPKVYKIIGSIMVSTDKEKLTKDLTSKKEIVELRIKNIEKQEDKQREKMKALQDELMKEMGA